MSQRADGVAGRTHTGQVRLCLCSSHPLSVSFRTAGHQAAKGVAVRKKFIVGESVCELEVTEIGSAGL